MASIRALLNDKLAQLMFKEFAIDDVRDVSAHFRLFRVSGEGVRCAPGDKLQIMVADAGPRTFSPFSSDDNAGTFEILAYIHGDTPGALWARRAERGQRFRGFGPRGSLPLASLAGPIVLFGDETALGTAKALADLRGAADGVQFIFESSHPAETTDVLSELGMHRATVVGRAAERGHVGELEAQLRAALVSQPGATLVLTGHAQTIQAVRARLRDGQARKQKVKPYWADGKRGLD